MTYEGLNPWQALNAIKNEAETWDIPLSEIGLDNYDIDSLLQTGHTKFNKHAMVLVSLVDLLKSKYYHFKGDFATQLSISHSLYWIRMTAEIHELSLSEVGLDNYIIPNPIHDKEYVNTESLYRSVLSKIIDDIFEYAKKYSGKLEGIMAYDLLLTMKEQSDALGLDLSDIGLTEENMSDCKTKLNS